MLSDIKRLRALLAEARQWVGSGGPPTVEARLSVGALRARIDAELAKPEVEWAPDTFWGDDAVEARVDGVHISVHTVDWEDERPWTWTISRSERMESGEAPTKAEAVAAALKAAGAL